MLNLDSREESAAPSESPRRRTGRGLSLVRHTPTRDEPGYWEQRPEDHGADGLYDEGPREARPSVVGMIGGAVEFAPAREKQPAAVRRQMGRDATRAARQANSDRARARALASLGLTRAA